MALWQDQQPQGHSIFQSHGTLSSRLASLRLLTSNIEHQSRQRYQLARPLGCCRDFARLGVARLSPTETGVANRVSMALHFLVG